MKWGVHLSVSEELKLMQTELLAHKGIFQIVFGGEKAPQCPALIEIITVLGHGYYLDHRQGNNKHPPAPSLVSALSVGADALHLLL